jgi:lipoic acid synthetase
MDRKPEWMRVKISDTNKLNKVNNILESYNLNTVCVSANCPNRLECFSKRTATFMILGDVCTRNCKFCNVTKGKPTELDLEEAKKVAKAVKELGLKHAVITSVTRDDLIDGGASVFANVIEEIRKIDSTVSIEVLIPDFNGNWDALQKVIDAKPDVINHNIETVPSLYFKVRPSSVYERSLELLRRVKENDPSIKTKSGIMVGLGETLQEMEKSFQDLLDNGCSILTIGQYLPPSEEHVKMERYVTPEEFDNYKIISENMGFSYVASSPMVRSSYNAHEALK